MLGESRGERRAVEVVYGGEPLRNAMKPEPDGVHACMFIFHVLPGSPRTLLSILIIFFRLSPAPIQTVADRVSPSRDARDYITCPQSLSWPELDRRTEEQKTETTTTIHPLHSHSQSQWTGMYLIPFIPVSCFYFLFLFRTAWSPSC